ncbi:hypothetical protein CJ030_MR1G018623 [Morella rubra]|uniref:Uncharacterized protein n=1 Tax=Morella rubra TaxID=262757 RepID=A0A6A1WK24_9ROSI|nr:hypothetical protein CJ030_MR1G018623 [Morella rubra]
MELVASIVSGVVIETGRVLCRSIYSKIKNTVEDSGAVEHIPGPSIRDQTPASESLARTMTLLSDLKVQRIGIWGMGGIGKTTLNANIKKIQTQIADRLNLEAKKGESLERLAGRLYQRLQCEEKFLLILDDVWEKIDLDRLGIPWLEFGTGSKIILTTRFRDVCRYMKTDVDVKLEGLNDEEAWELFSLNAGDVVNLEHLRPLAKAIVKECCGLPLAITTVGAATRGKTMVALWEDALNELRRSRPCIGGIEDEVYKPLKWSYDTLQGKNTKPCFLYCALFPEDFSIEIKELVQYWLAEGLIDEQETYEDSVNRGIALIEYMKDSCLLQDGTREDTVKMHDIVRDVALWIASSSEDGCKSLVCSGMGLSDISVDKFSNSLQRISFMNNKITKLPDCSIECSKASTLLLQGNPPLDSIPERFFQGFGALKVLNMSGTSISSLPLSLLQLGDLRALLLRYCSNLEELPPLGGLSRLIVLDLCATRIRELPSGMENLSNLRQLNLSYTKYLKTIQSGIIPRLYCLESLDMRRCGYQLRSKEVIEEEQEELQTSFEELVCLERLLVLSIRLDRIPYDSPKNLSWINRLRRFQLYIGSQAYLLSPTGHEERRVTIGGLDLSTKWIGWLLSNASSFVLISCWKLNQMLENLAINSVGSFACLKSLTIATSDSSFRPGGGCAAPYDLLPNLEELHLEQLTSMESISELVGHLGLRFLRLRLIEVTWCSNMKYLLSCHSLIQTLPNLEVIEISSCGELNEIFKYPSLQTIAPYPVVPNLQTLKLENLPKLRTLCKDEKIWPRLRHVDVIKCDLLRKLPLTVQNAANMKEIRGEAQWWNALDWDADTTRSSLQPYFFSS